MNLTLHHFQKEAQHIRLRWCLWIGLVILDLALQLEWLMPMTGLEFGNSLPGLSHNLVLGCAVILNLSGCAEDLPSRDGAFIATRPLPRVSYYLARAGVVLFLFVLPLMLQEASYLALSHRPGSQVLTGAAWQGVVAGAWLAWTVPSAALWKNWLQALIAIGVVFCGLWLCAEMAVLGFAGQAWMRGAELSESGFVLTAWTAFLVWCVLARWNRRAEPTIRQKMAVVAASAPFLYALLLAWAVTKGSQHANDARVDELAAAVKTSIPQERLRPLLNVTYQGRPAQAFYGPFQTTGLPAEVEMRSRLKQVRASQAGKSLPAHRTEDDTVRVLQKEETGFEPGSLVNALPPGTVLVPPSLEMARYGEDPLEHALGRVEMPAGGQDAGPLTLECDFESEWFEWSKAADLPLQPGARVMTDNAEMLIEKILPDTAPWDHAPPGLEKGTLKFYCRMHQRTQDTELYCILYSPEERLAWCLGPWLTPMAERAVHTGWSRHLGVLFQRGVLSHGDGAPASDLSKLRLVVMQRRHLGSSSWTWKSQPINVRQHVPGHRDWYYASGIPLTGDALKLLEKRIDGLAMPDALAPREELNGYVLDVLKAFHALKKPELQNKQYDLVVAKLRPFAQRHLDVLLDLPSSAVAGPTSPVFRLAKELTTEAHRDLVVGRIMEADWLAALATAKGWSEYAREKMLAATLTVPRHEKHLRTLMLGWNDPAVRRRQLAELKYFPDASTFEALYTTPELRPELDRLAQDLWQEMPPVATWEIVSRPKLEIAVAQGNVQALDLALHWLARGYLEDRSYDINQTRQLALSIAKVIGMAPPAGNNREFFKGFRGSVAEQFEYMPDQRGWRTKP